ncbi:MAG: hypothetical protein O7G85_14400 [Planctomycetota bacterium]|nr:hypothetical protein [Planctomycetota bacterium]
MLNRHAIVWAAIAALTLSFTHPSGGQSTPSDTDVNVALIDRLHETIIDVEYDAIDLEDVIADLREAHDLNIHVSWKHLFSADVHKNDRVEIKLRQVSLALLLNMLLDEAQSDILNPLDYSVRGGIVVISTRDLLSRDTILKTYDITDLIESGYSIRRFANTPVLGMKLTGREHLGGEALRAKPKTRGGGGGNGAGGGSGAFGDPTDDPDRLTSMERVEQIIGLIVDYINPDTWSMNGGEVGMLSVHGNTLFIQHTIDDQRNIESFLHLLRQGQPIALDAEAIVVHLRADRAARWRETLGDSFPRLMPSQIDQLLDEDEGGEVLFRATTTGHNGERFWFSALTQREVLSGMWGTISSNKAGFNPVTGIVTEGLELIVLPLLKPDGERLFLDVQFAWIPTSDIQTRSVALNGETSDATIDHVNRSMRTVSCSATLGLDQAIALSIPRQLDDTGRALEYEDWLIIRVKRVP